MKSMLSNSAQQPTLSVIIPTYRSAAGLSALVDRLLPVLRDCSSAFEIIFVDDGSRDGTRAEIERLCQIHPQILGIFLMRNYGQHSAILCGIRVAHHEISITMDDDLQHPPEEIPRLLEALTDEVDVVYGTPLTEQHGFLRDLASRLSKFVLISSMGAEMSRKASAYRVFRTRLRRAFTDFEGTFVLIDMLLTWGTTRFTWLAVRHDPRVRGVSNYTTRKLVSHALNVLTSSSTLPLRLASLLGFGLTLFGGIVLVWVVGRYLLAQDSVPGFPFLASIIAIFSGSTLLCLGIMGEYLARMHVRLMHRPSYVVQEIHSIDAVETPEQVGVASQSEERLGDELISRS